MHWYDTFWFKAGKKEKILQQSFYCFVSYSVKNFFYLFVDYMLSTFGLTVICWPVQVNTTAAHVERYLLFSHEFVTFVEILLNHAQGMGKGEATQ